MKLTKKIRTFLNIINAIVVRFLLLVHSLFIIWRAVDVQGNSWYWLLGLSNLALIAETLYTVIKRNGQEGKWFCPCFLFYLFGTMPALWLLELDKIDRYNHAVSYTNISEQKEALSSIYAINLPITLEPDIWVSVLEQTLVFLLIVGRWLLPRGHVTRKQLSSLLIVYIEAGSDILDFFIVFEESEVRKDRLLSYVSLGVWSFSLLQFCLVLTATKSHHRGAMIVTDNNVHVKGSFCERLLVTEIWSLLLSTMLLDFPYLCVRMYILVIMKILSYGILFFTCKNIILIVVVIYRIIILCVDNDNDIDSVKIQKQERYGLQEKRSKSKDHVDLLI